MEAKGQVMKWLARRNVALVLALMMARALSPALADGQTRRVPGPQAVYTTESCSPFLGSECLAHVTIDESGRAEGRFSIASPGSGLLPGRGAVTARAHWNFKDTIDSELDSVVYQAVFHLTQAEVRHDGLLHSTGKGLSGAASIQVLAAAFSVTDCSRGSGEVQAASSETGPTALAGMDVTLTWTLRDQGCGADPVPDVVHPGSVAIRLWIEGNAVLQGETLEFGNAGGSFNVTSVEVTASDVAI